MASAVAIVSGMPAYPTNRLIVAAVEGLEIQPLQLEAGSWRPRSLRECRRVLKSCSTVVVTYPAHRPVLGIRLAGFGLSLRLVVAPLVLLYDSRVLDRGEVRTASMRARGYRLADRLLSRAASVLVADTSRHAEHMSAELQRPVEHAPLGSIIELERAELVGRGPAPFTGELRLVHYGSFFPIQGVDVMLEAIRGLEGDVVLHLVGTPASSALGTHSNVVVHPRMELAELLELMSSCHAVLGQFGATPQQQRVIPTKVYDAMAIGLPVITARNDELADLSTGGAVRLVESGDAEGLREAILDLKADSDDGLLAALGRTAAEIYDKQLSLRMVTKSWGEILATESAFPGTK